ALASRELQQYEGEIVASTCASDVPNPLTRRLDVLADEYNLVRAEMVTLSTTEYVAEWTFRDGSRLRMVSHIDDDGRIRLVSTRATR
ncbi:MAG: hypothetical protein Q7U89_04665, partial [Coriobacteriia bacterium]|nr:hypothetical protein [Coriobacteriia bacterium]